MSKKNGFRHRFDFSKIPATIQIPNLIEVQKRSYERFLQMDRLPSERDLATELQVSRTTVTSAYERLRDTSAAVRSQAASSVAAIRAALTL